MLARSAASPTEQVYLRPRDWSPGGILLLAVQQIFDCVVCWSKGACMLKSDLSQPRRPQLDINPGGEANIPGLLSPGPGSVSSSLNGRHQRVRPQTHLNASEQSLYRPAVSPGTRVREGNPAAQGGASGGSGESRSPRSQASPALPFYLMAVARKLGRG